MSYVNCFKIHFDRVDPLGSIRKLLHSATLKSDCLIEKSGVGSFSLRFTMDEPAQQPKKTYKKREDKSLTLGLKNRNEFFDINEAMTNTSTPSPPPTTTTTSKRARNDEESVGFENQDQEKKKKRKYNTNNGDKPLSLSESDIQKLSIDIAGIMKEYRETGIDECSISQIQETLATDLRWRTWYEKRN